MNAFFLNLIIFLCSNFSLTLFICNSMKNFTNSTYCSFLFNQNVSSVRSLSWAFKNSIFEILILVP